ncbi:ubiquinone/menaquinone biosynthesis C-methylase UbiE [Mycolicibacterium sp. BK556]|uniref:class I SAM-dependent methyltransferase n=1 Tax=unclassified Mycolicibacterium TaxID=2636767 RepID=UPI00160EED0A|nr:MULTISPECIES: class I SAM-dependent methyltransferase [unclassified Mycolicibacterium]MBB3601926.1 ubiquinone/menaquinone biosynthesis C-methylase UbiE [Mycolicibacterium sp. BK556]MBB3631678.1 ubiquinone/menaquinone biosynthesis C-methylase UbiE [Mycolicibacterium sp. BK607]MBB3749682.1 ubiquinone/menaquinone biosynthesis C-methylase UbiE [Mycolicibacterium sp. BK634]
MPTTILDTMLRRARAGIGTFPYPHQAAALLDNPLRRRMENPAQTIEVIELTGTERVLEIGPGPGFFSAELAGRLNSGQLDLFDIQPQMLAKARRKLEAAGHHDVGYTAGQAGAALPFPAGTFDAAFLAEVIGEVPDKQACVRSLAVVLKPGGKLVFHEAFPDPDRLSVTELRELCEPAGFVLDRSVQSRWKDIVRFRRTP